MTITTPTAKPEATAAQQQSSASKKGKVEKAQSYLGLTSTAIGVAGALGTGFVWLASNLLVGDISIKPDRPVEAIQVKVTDKHGQQATYFGQHIQLMPGTYHLEVGVPGKVLKHADASVGLWQANEIALSIPDGLTSGEDQQQPEQNRKKHWWQIWKR